MKRAGELVLYQSDFVTGWFWWVPGKGVPTSALYLTDTRTRSRRNPQLHSTQPLL
jgi:hypothetical protein